MCRQKDLEIGFRNPHQPIEAMGDQKTLLDPAPNRAVAYPHALSNLFNREEFCWRLCVFRFHHHQLPLPPATRPEDQVMGCWVCGHLSDFKSETSVLEIQGNYRLSREYFKTPRRPFWSTARAKKP